MRNVVLVTGSELFLFLEKDSLLLCTKGPALMHGWLLEKYTTSTLSRIWGRTSDANLATAKFSNMTIGYKLLQPQNSALLSLYPHEENASGNSDCMEIPQGAFILSVIKGNNK